MHTGLIHEQPLTNSITMDKLNLWKLSSSNFFFEREARDLPLFLLNDKRKTIKYKQITTKTTKKQLQPGSKNYTRKKKEQGPAEATD